MKKEERTEQIYYLMYADLSIKNIEAIIIKADNIATIYNKMKELIKEGKYKKEEMFIRTVTKTIVDIREVNV